MGATASLSPDNEIRLKSNINELITHTDIRKFLFKQNLNNSSQGLPSSLQQITLSVSVTTETRPFAKKQHNNVERSPTQSLVSASSKTSNSSLSISQTTSHISTQSLSP